MPFGRFLESFPSLLFVAAHVMFLLVGVWAWRSSAAAKRSLGLVFVLYGLSQLAFLGFFGGVITMKMAVLAEQTLMVIAMLLVAMRRTAHAES